MKTAQQEISPNSCTLRLELDSHEIWYNHEGGVAIDTSDDCILRMMVDTGLVKKTNILIIDFDHDGEESSHVVGYKTIKTIQHNQNDYTFIFLN